MKKVAEKIKKHKVLLIVLFLIFILSLFLRVWHYSDLMRFGKDQARDASIIRDIISEKSPLPLLGPKAGGTDFKMGPIFYYFQYASVKIFGNSPDKMAYPDLLFSLLTIPLMYFFLKKYFNEIISVSLTALYGVSFFAVQNGRFAWNPNSLLFFSILFLYAFLELINPKRQKKIIWAGIAGVALGVGVQLHTLYILIIPTVLVIFSAYLIRKRLLTFKNLVIILSVALFLNIPQIISEVKTGGQNTKDFFSGITEKSINKNAFPVNLYAASLWDIQANTMFIIPFGDDTRLYLLSTIDAVKHNEEGLRGLEDDILVWLRIAFGLLITLSGYFLIGYYLKKEKDDQKKIFLKIIAFYIAFSFLLLISLSHVLMLRYFLILQFVPFLLLGLIIKFFQERFSKTVYLFSFFILFIFFIINAYSVISELRSFIDSKGDVGIAIWSEEKFAGNFILAHMDPDQKVYMVYEPQNANKFIRSLSYFEDSIEAPPLPNDGTPLEDKNVAYFSLILNTKKEKSMFNRKISGSHRYEITDSATYGRIAIYKLNLKPL